MGFFNPSSWKNPSGEKSPEDPEENSAASAGSSISSSLFSAIGKVPGFTKVSPTEEEPGVGESCDGDKTEDQPGAAGGFFSAFSKMGISGMSSSATVENISAMKKLGLTKNDSEWEAELEGELNEYEMVGEDGEAVGSEDNPEWENQIEEMLEAETKKS